MIAGLIVGLSLGRNDAWFWGIAIGFMLAQSARLHARVKSLERSRQLRSQPTKPSTGIAVPTAADPAAELDAKAVEPEREPVAPGTPAGPDILPDASSKPAPVVVQSATPVAQAEYFASSRPAEAKPAKPAGPTLLQRGFALVLRFFTEGNPLVRIGVLVMT